MGLLRFLPSFLRFLPGGGILSTILSAPTWVWLVLAALAYTAYVRNDAKNSERALCNAEALTAEVAALRQQARASEAVARSAISQSKITAEENASLQEKIDDFEQKLTANPSCQLSADDIKRLQAIR